MTMRGLTLAIALACAHAVAQAQGNAPCQACGACCSYSSNWPRFTIEDDAALDLIPEKFVNDRLSGMRCDGDRCSALSGKVGVATACGIYALRPEVCRTCMPGDAECDMARRRHGLAVLVQFVVSANAGTHTA